ncbi:MAG: hypothetical protein JXQ68_07510 [Campylobacterales bacterium]|nr:hypothetical protein [Campylobacterales bacterium]
MTRKIQILAIMAIVALIFFGCSSKQYFEPEKSFSASAATKSASFNIVSATRDGATLTHDRYIDNYGIGSVSLGEGYSFVNSDANYILASNQEGNLRVIDRASGEAILLVALHTPIVSAAVHGNTIVYLLQNNVFGVYEIKGNKKIAEHRSDYAYAVDSRIANPIFVDGLIVVPTLDGKILISSMQDPNMTKVMYISSERGFNNLIFLDRIGDTLVAATPSRLVSLGNSGPSSFDAGISDVSVDDNSAYIFEKNGEITHVDASLNSIAHIKFKFAKYVAGKVFGDKVYALDYKGSLIVLDKALTTYKIYDVGSVDSPVFMSDGKLYKDGKVIDLSLLGL